MSVPVYVALSEERYSRWGVFNIEDKKADAMSDTDCYVACIFASLLAQGYNISQENYSRLEVEHKTAAPA